MIRELPDALRDVTPDGLKTPRVGAWAELKYRLLFHYASMFASSMKVRWDRRVYVDLFACAGRAELKGTKRTVLTSPLLAMSVDVPFDRYILCESNESILHALRARVNTGFGSRDVRFVAGDCNDNVDEIIRAMPAVGKGATALAFCFIDPCKVSHLRFETIRRLAERYVDFLVLIPTGMDINRNLDVYLRENNTLLDDFLGTHDWRFPVMNARRSGESVGLAVGRVFEAQMRALRYTHGGIADSVLVRYSPTNVALYRLGFFSRHQLGGKFWKEALHASNPQGSLFGK
jgi:three-Cys-motif partner protein